MYENSSYHKIDTRNYIFGNFVELV